MKKNNSNQNAFSKAFRSVTKVFLPKKTIEQKRAVFSRMVTKDMSKLFIKLGER